MAFPYFMVRTKVDIDVWNNQEDNQLDEKATLTAIVEDFKANHAVDSIYLISSRNPAGFDMPRLIQDMFPGSHTSQLDPKAPAFCPSAPAWNEPWAMPQVFSATLAGIQGRWYDRYNAVYLVQDNAAHVTLQRGDRAVVPLSQSEGRCVWWCGRWSIDEAAAVRARQSSELRWAPKDLQDEPLVWWWAD